MMQHGTRSMYGHGKCRCDACREAVRKYTVSLYARRRSQPLPQNIVHGRRGTYCNWGCRCEACTKAQTDYCREYRR